MTTLGFCDLGVRYGGTEAVRGFNDLLHAGEWLCLIGPNGAGKSSVLRAAAGLVRYSGSVAVDQVEIPAASPRWRSRRIAYVPQSPVMPADMRVGEYVLLGRNPWVGHFSRESAADRAAVRGVIEALELGALAGRRVGDLSGGERQRMVVARALAQEAPVLLLDEPTSALDVGHQQHALELVDRLRRERGLTVVSAMHDLTLAGLYADRLVLMHQGVRVAAGTASEVLVPEVLAEFYGASVRVHTDPDGTVVVVPVRPRSGTVPG
ncbi:MAG: ABC transporter ATP-binding protein [Acidobacteria bacterium]|nr:ABC transporter ATP-binding protein [Acidobacteriota bacterium]